jgi:hypothetical protein
MTDLRTAAQQALEALESLFTLQVDYARPKQCGDAITALRAALEQPEQTCNCRWVGDVLTQQCTLHEAHVDAIHGWAERAKAAEAKLKQPGRAQQQRDAGFTRRPTIREMSEPEQPEQEPVASIYVTIGEDREFDDWRCPLPVGRNLLYTYPPRREWRGLTEEEVDQMAGNTVDAWECARAVEAALRSKNYE